MRLIEKLFSYRNLKGLDDGDMWSFCLHFHVLPKFSLQSGMKFLIDSITDVPGLLTCWGLKFRPD